MMPKLSGKIALVVIYNSAELYPPTLNALDILAGYFEKVKLIELDNFPGGSSVLPSNVNRSKLSYSNANISERIKSFYRFIREIRRSIIKMKPSLVLFYDAEAALGVLAALAGRRKYPPLWYHVHDTADKKYIIKYSLNDYSLRFQKRIFPKLTAFTLPAEERKSHFDLSRFKGKYACIPNYPLKKSISDHQSSPPQHEVILVYQGRVCEGRGIEDAIKLLPFHVNGMPVKLKLIGYVAKSYRGFLEKLIDARRINKLVSFEGVVQNRRLPELTSNCHIGLAIYTSSDNIHSTLGTASNKSYEYMACGLPFLYYKSTHFEHHFVRMGWAIPTDLTEASMRSAIEHLVNNYTVVSNAAKKEFAESRNYEKVFIPVMEKIIGQSG